MQENRVPFIISAQNKLLGILILVGIYAFFVDRASDGELQSMLEATGAFATTAVLGMLLGFRTNASYDRWWEARKLWGQLVNQVRNLAIKADLFFANDETGKQEIASQLQTFPVLLKDHLRALAAQTPGAMPVEPSVATRHLPLASAKEITALIVAARQAGTIDGFQQMQLDAHASQLMDVCGACERIKLTPIAVSYRNMFRIGIALNVLGLPWLLSAQFHKWCIPLVLISAFFLVGLELIAEEIEEPFGLGGDNLPLESICQSIKQSVLQVFQ